MTNYAEMAVYLREGLSTAWLGLVLALCEARRLGERNGMLNCSVLNKAAMTVIFTRIADGDVETQKCCQYY